MKKFNIFRLVLCVSVIALTSSRALAAGPVVTIGNTPLDVNVTNPISISGTPSVNVSNTVPVTGTVSVSNLSSVSGTVTVDNSTSNPVPTQNVGGGAATQVGQPTGNLVNLACFPVASSIFGNCEQVTTIGTFSGSSYSVPSGKTLVLTDAEWSLYNSPKGSTTFWGVQVNGGQVAFATAFGDSGGLATGELHFATGVVAATGTTITATTGLSTAAGNNSSTYMQGYLVPTP